jgi:hypothetical protein
MKSAELLVTNVILDPTYKPVKLSLVGAMVRPVIAGRALPPRATRILSMNELNAGVVDDLIRGIEHGALRVRLRVGAQRDMSIDEIRALAGIPVLSASVEVAAGLPLAQAEAAPEPTPVAEVVAPEPVVEPEPEPVVEPAVEEVAPVVEETPEPVATPEDLLAPEPVAEEKAAYTADALMALKSDQLSELLVAEFAYPADQLYKLKTKQAKIDEILARQGE